MSKIDDLIKQYCPNGIKYEELGNIGVFYGGLSGKNKDDFKDGNCKYVTYTNIYSNPALKIDIEDRVNVQYSEKQNTIQYGDVLFTGSSETPDECGFSSVVTQKINEKIYLNSFCFGFRLNDLTLFNPLFLKHLFRSYEIRKQIAGTASGVTRFNISKKRFAKIKIPVPPLSVQEEIVRILDAFSSLEAELEAELEARKKQYEYYRNKLLTFDENTTGGGIDWKMLSEVCNIYTGGEVPEDSIKGDIPDDTHIYPIYGNGKEIYGYSSSYRIDKDAVCISSIGANTGAVFFYKKNFTPIIRLKVLVPKNDNLNIRYLYHIATTLNFVSKNNGGIPNMNANDVKKHIIPVPPLEEQERIVAILDKFDSLVNDISKGLPAELTARRQQYEYYRNKLLTFDEAA